MAYPSNSGATDDAPKRGKKASKAAMLKLARARYKQWLESDAKQLKRELADIDFYNGNQWPDDIKRSRAGLEPNNGLPPVPARPCITINKTREPVRTVLNQERGSDIAIEIVAADDFGDLTGPVDETEITLREGLVRRIQRESQAADARTWAFSRGTIAGRGYYGVMVRYVGGKSRDREVYVCRYYDQSCVCLDPMHEQPDGSDAEWAIVRTYIPWLTYKAQFKKRNGKDNAIASYEDGEWEGLGAIQPDWFKGEGDTRSVLVVDYYHVERTTREVVTFYDPATLEERSEWGDEIESGAATFPEGWLEVPDSRRDDIQKSIKFAKIDGCDDDVLEETDWPGPDMPIVKVLGEELHPTDAERKAEGMVRPMREPGQGFNAMVSQLVEVVALTPLDPPIVEEGTLEGYEEEWKSATTRRVPFLRFKKKNLDNERTESVPFSLARNPPIAPIAAGIQMFDDALQDVSISDPGRGQTDSTVKSAKHAGLLREQASQSTSNYMDNLKRSMRYEGQIINNLLFPIYGRPGRIARIINGQGEAETLLLHQPMVSQGGRPVAAQPDDPNAKKYTLTKDAKFNVGIKITSSKEFRREQEAQTVGELISAAPTLLGVFGDLYFKNLDGPGHDEMAERMKVMLDPKVLALLESKKSGQEIPPELQAKMAQGKQMIEQLQQGMQQLQQVIQQKQVEEQAETQRNDAKLKADIEMARIKAEADLAMEAMKQRTALTIEEFKLRGTQMQQEYDAVQADRDRLAAGAQQQGAQQHEAGMAQQAQGADADEAARQRAAAAQGQQSEQEHAAAMQQEQQAAAERQAAMAAQQPGAEE